MDKTFFVQTFEEETWPEVNATGKMFTNGFYTSEHAQYHFFETMKKPWTRSSVFFHHDPESGKNTIYSCYVRAGIENSSIKIESI